MKKASLIAVLMVAGVTALPAQAPPPAGGGRGPGTGPRQGPPPGGMVPGRGQGMGPGAGQMGPGADVGPGDPVMGNLFSPEMIMQNQEAIGLTEEQRGYMMQEMQRTQQSAQQIQWRLQAAMERLSNVVKQDRVDEGQVLTQLDSVLASEREMKRLQITLLVRLKSRLTPEQQAFLRGRMARGEE